MPPSSSSTVARPSASAVSLSTSSMTMTRCSRGGAGGPGRHRRYQRPVLGRQLRGVADQRHDAHQVVLGVGLAVGQERGLGGQRVAPLGRHGDLGRGEVRQCLDRLAGAQAHLQAGRPLPRVRLGLLERQRGAHVGDQQGVPGRGRQLLQRAGVAQRLEHPPDDGEHQPLGGRRPGHAELDRQDQVGRLAAGLDLVQRAQDQRRLADPAEPRDQERPAARVQDAAPQLGHQGLVAERRQRVLAGPGRLVDVTEGGHERDRQRAWPVAGGRLAGRPGGPVPRRRAVANCAAGAEPAAGFLAIARANTASSPAGSPASRELGAGGSSFMCAQRIAKLSLAPERRAAGQHLERRAGQAVLVGAAVRDQALDLLGRDVVQACQGTCPAWSARPSRRTWWSGRSR